MLAVRPWPPTEREPPCLETFTQRKPGMMRSRLRKRKPISEKGQIVWIGSRANEVLKAVLLTVATEYDEHKLIVPRLDPASLDFSGTTTIFHPLSNVFRSQLFDVDHGCLIRL